MESTRIFPILLAAILLIAFAPSIQAEDWKTIDGKVYQNVTVLHCDPDAVTILHKDGGALIPLEMLPDEIQKRFHYDPEKAKAAADERMQQEIDDARALRAEREQLANLQKAETDEAAANASAKEESDAASSTASTSDHHSMDELTDSANSLWRDLTDPDYYTMAHLAMEASELRPDPTDPNHHSMSEIADSGL